MLLWAAPLQTFSGIGRSILESIRGDPELPNMAFRLQMFANTRRRYIDIQVRWRKQPMLTTHYWLAGLLRSIHEWTIGGHERHRRRARVLAQRLEHRCCAACRATRGVQQNADQAVGAIRSENAPSETDSPLSAVL